MTSQDRFHSIDLLGRLMTPFQTVLGREVKPESSFWKPRLKGTFWRSLTTWGLDQDCQSLGQSCFWARSAHSPTLLKVRPIAMFIFNNYSSQREAA